MFNHKYQIRPAFYLDPPALKRRFMLCGVAHAVFLPFLLFFMTLHFSMQNIYDMKSSRQYLGPRDWTLPAKWTFREFNELPHFYERRMGPSYEATESYLKLFTQSTIVTTIGQLLVLTGGSLAAILVAFAALNDAILLNVKIGDWNLLWYVGVLGVVYSGGKSLQPGNGSRPRYIRNIFGEMDATLAEVATHTHYYPEVWKARAWDRGTYKAVSAMFQYKAKLFVHEVVSVVLAPIILCVSLPKCAEQICEFVMAIKAEVPGAGEVCGYSTFNFDLFGDESWEGRTLGVCSDHGGHAYGINSDMAGSLTASVMLTKSVDAATKLHPTPKAMNGKMEKSFFSFKSNNPGWPCTESGKPLVDRVEKFKTEEEEALARERQHHIEAAAHQLEILTQLEPRQQRDRRVAGEADSGGGLIPREEARHGGTSSHHQATVPPVGPSEDPLSSSRVNEHVLNDGLSYHLERSDHRRESINSGVGDSFILAAGHRPTAVDRDRGERTAETQYRLLERYHSHVTFQRQAQSFVEDSGNRTSPDRAALPTMREDGSHFDGRHSMT
jgi:autophagy-related protein 9